MICGIHMYGFSMQKKAELERHFLSFALFMLSLCYENVNINVDFDTIFSYISFVFVLFAQYCGIFL